MEGEAKCTRRHYKKFMPWLLAVLGSGSWEPCSNVPHLIWCSLLQPRGAYHRDIELGCYSRFSSAQGFWKEGAEASNLKSAETRFPGCW